MVSLLVDVGPLRSAPAFRRLWIGQTCSGLGGQMSLVAVLFQVWEATNSPVWTGFVGLAQAIPVILFGLFAGTVIDRVDRRSFYLVMVIGQAACAVLLAVQGFTGGVPVVVVLLLVAAQSSFGAGAGPAARTFLPRLLPETRLAAGLALNRISFQGAMLAGPALGGVVLGAWGAGVCYLIDAVLFGLAFYGAFGLPPMRPDGDPARPGLRGVADGLTFLVRTPVVRGALLTDLAATVFAMPMSLFPLVNAERFGGDPRTLGLFLSAVAVGGVAASVLSGTFTRQPRTGWVVLAASATWGVALALFGIAPDAWTGLALLVVAGAADTVAVVSRSTIVQLATPDGMRGRVMAAEQIIGQAGPELGNLRGGLVAGATSGAVALSSGGLLAVAGVVLVGAATPGLRRFSVRARGRDA
ncbi:MFS transporter [Amycolatopsis suaedae]|uniref:MFS transporter n=1 Tax=Amycolatopsis suaedae TaxID=2510978 RepID=A0A4Q7J6S0_9PSEU|nr:MFS transporter [Amycolatopsis suaedae]